MFEIKGARPDATVWVVFSDGRVKSETQMLHGARTTATPPPWSRYINIVLSAPLNPEGAPGQQYVTRWCAPGKIVGAATAPAATSVVGSQLMHGHYVPVATGVTLTALVTIAWLAPVTRAKAGDKLTDFNTTWLLASICCKNLGWPLLRWLSIFRYHNETLPNIFAGAVASVIHQCGLKPAAPLSDNVCDALLQMVLRATSGKYAYDMNARGEKTDNRDHYGLSHGTGKDCDGQAQHAVAFGWALRNMAGAEVANVRAGTSRRTLAVCKALHARLLKYRGMALVFGAARNPNSGPSGTVFGHCYAVLLPGVGMAKCPIIEPTAIMAQLFDCADELCAAMTRLYRDGDYPMDRISKSTAYLGAKEIKPYMYPSVWYILEANNMIEMPPGQFLTRELLTDDFVTRLLRPARPQQHALFHGISPFLLTPCSMMIRPPAAPSNAREAIALASATFNGTEKVGFAPAPAGVVNDADPPGAYFAICDCAGYLAIQG